MVFEPQKVSSDSWLYWLVEAFKLVFRQPLLQVTICGAMVFLSSIPKEFIKIFLWSLIVFLGVLCLIAEATDKKICPLKKLSTKHIHTWCALFTLNAILFMPLILLNILLTPFINGFEENGIDTLNQGGALFTLFFLVFVTSGWILWLLIPLVFVGEVHPVVAISQAKKCLIKNRFIFFFIIGITMSTITFRIIEPFLVIPWTMIVGATMYTSYRHIWIERGNINPFTIKTSGARHQENLV